MASSPSQDPFNWPMPNRADLMSLGTLSKEKDLFRVKTAAGTMRVRSTSQNLEVNDIRGTQPKVWIKQEVNRPEFQNVNWDIDRSCPRALHFQLNKPEYNLTNADIEKTKPNYIKFQTTRPPSNPLNPVYKVSEVEYRPPTPPKFIRDSIGIDDIDGSKPKKTKYYATRNIMGVQDIDGTTSKKVYVRSTAYDSFNYNDITKNKFTSSRSVNPLNPSYTVKDEDGNQMEIGEIKGSSPKKLPYRKPGVTQTNLEIKDINGTAAGSRTLGNFHSRERTQYREINNIQEVPGAQTGTLKKGLISNRITNPLNPTYVLPGSTELGSTHMNDPYGNGGSSLDSKFVQIQKQMEARQQLLRAKSVKDVVANEKDFKKDMAKFYSVNPGATKDVDLNQHIGQKGKENTNTNSDKARPFTAIAAVGQDQNWKQNQKAFFGIDNSDTQSQWKKNVNNFFDKSQEPPVAHQIPQRAQTAYNSVRPENNLEVTGQKPMPESKLFLKNAAKFYGDADCGMSMSSQGSLFQKNAAQFYGMEQPGPGERPFKIQKPSIEEVKVSKGFSVLNEQRLKQHELNVERDPKFIKNKERFYGTNNIQKRPSSVAQSKKSNNEVLSQAKSKLSHAQKLDSFIQTKQQQ